jgi:hypothetical protein
MVLSGIVTSCFKLNAALALYALGYRFDPRVRGLHRIQITTAEIHLFRLF